MAVRVNVKFLAILSVSVMFLAGGAYMAHKILVNNPERRVKQAREHVEQGELLKSMRRFNQAISREEDYDLKIAYLEELEGVIRRIEPQNTTELRTMMGALMGTWDRVLKYDPSNIPAAEKLLEFHYENAFGRGNVNAWEVLDNSATDLLEIEPDHRKALVYQAIAQCVRCDILDLNAVQRAEVRELLDKAVEIEPENGQLAYYSALLYLVEADAEWALNEKETASEQATQGFEQLKSFVAAHPDDYHSRLGMYTYLIRMRRFDTGMTDEAINDYLMAVMTESEVLLLETHDPQQTARLARVLQFLDRERVEVDGVDRLSGQLRSEKLLRHLLEQDADNLEAGLELAGLLREMGRDDEALALLEEVKQDRPMALSMRAFRVSDWRVFAMKQMIDIKLERYAKDEEGTDREALMASCEALLAEMRPIVGEGNVYVKAIEGRIALFAGETRKAIGILEAANDVFEESNYDVLLDLGRAYTRTGEVGAAAEYYDKALKTGEGTQNVLGVLELARLRLQTNEPEKAIVVLEQFLARAPDYAPALLLMSQARDAQVQQSGGAGLNSDQKQREYIAAQLKLLEPAVEAGNRASTMKATQYRVMLGEVEVARDLLASYYADNSTDYGVLEMLNRMDRHLGNEAAAQERLDAAVAADPDNKYLKLMVSGDNEEQTQEIVQSLLDEEQDDLERELRYYRYYNAIGEEEKAEASFAKAVALDAEDERVLSIRFERAEASGDWDEAESIVTLVSEMNDGEGLDYAKGATWRGRLLLARGEYREAIDVLQRASDEMRNNSRVLRMLGEALLGAGDVAGAQRSLRESLTLRPSSVEAWRAMHRVHDRMQRHDVALEDLREALRYSGGKDKVLRDEYLTYLGRHGDLREAVTLRARLAQSEPELFENRRALGNLFLRGRAFDQARQVFEKLMEDDPGNVDTALSMANLIRLQDQVDNAKRMANEFMRSLGDEAESEDWMKYAQFMRYCEDDDAARAGYRRAIELESTDRPTASLDMADWEFASRRYEQSGAIYRATLEKIGDSQITDLRESVHRRYAESLLLNGQLDAAAAEVEKLVERSPKNVEVVMLKARVGEERLKSEGLSESERARLQEMVEVTYDRAVSLSVADPMPYIQRAKYFFENEDPVIQSSVRDDLQRAIQLDPSRVVSRQMLVKWAEGREDYEMAIRELWELIGARPDYLKARIDLAQLCMQTNRFVEADRVLSDSISTYPNEPVWYRLRAILYTATEEFTDAERDLARAYELKPALDTFVLYGNVLLRLDRDERFLELLKDHAEALNQVSVLQAMRGRALAGVGRTDEAKRAFGLAFDKAGADLRFNQLAVFHMGESLSYEDQVSVLSARMASDESGMLHLAMSRIQVETNKFDAAISTLEAEIGRFAPDSVGLIETYNLLGQAHYGKEAFETARAYYEKVLAIDADNLVALNNLAYILADNLGDPEGALAHAQYALELTKNTSALTQRSNVLDTVGYVQYKLGDMAQAEDTLKESIRLKADSANKLHLAMVYLAQNQRSQAKDQLIEAKELVEDSTDEKVRDEILELMSSLDGSAEVLER